MGGFLVLLAAWAMVVVGLVFCLAHARGCLRAALSDPWYPGTLTALLALWLIGAPFPALAASAGAGVTLAPPSLHLLGAGALTLMFGPYLAVPGLLLVGGVLAVAGPGGLGGLEMAPGPELFGAWARFGMEGVLGAIVPVLVVVATVRVIARRPPVNPFLYILGAGFGGAGLYMLVTGGLRAALLAALEGGEAWRSQLEATVLLAFPEAFVNGAVVAALAAFRPWRLAGFQHLVREEGGR